MPLQISKVRNLSSDHVVEVRHKWGVGPSIELGSLGDFLAFVDETYRWKVQLCEVKGCFQESGNQGTCWRETGYWCVCHKHASMFRQGSPQPDMKPSAVYGESLRDVDTGFMPTDSDLLMEAWKEANPDEQ